MARPFRVKSAPGLKSAPHHQPRFGGAFHLVTPQLRSPRFAGTLARNSNAMSQLLIQQYLNQLATLKKVSGTQRKSVVRGRNADCRSVAADIPGLLQRPYSLPESTI